MWAPSGELDIYPTAAVGFRIAWEVPGFIGIRWDSGFVGWAEMEVKNGFGPGRQDADIDGFIQSHQLSLAIFNPELSVDGLAFWAGFGAGLWIFDFSEDNVFRNPGSTVPIDVDWSDSAISGNIFVEIDYKVTDLIHIGFMVRPHLVLADWTDDGRFYDFNGVSQSNGGTTTPPSPTGPPYGDRNGGIFDDAAVIMEISLQVSISF